MVIMGNISGKLFYSICILQVCAMNNADYRRGKNFSSACFIGEFSLNDSFIAEISTNRNRNPGENSSGSITA
jgi:hypothetical protein